MKTLIIAVIFLLTMVDIHGQNLDEKAIAKNEIDLVITDLLDGSFQLKYERALGNHFSVNLGLGYKGKYGFVSRSGLDTDKIKTDGLFYSGFKIIPELRYYLRNGDYAELKGFYLGAYLKYSNFHADLGGKYITNAQEQFELEFDASIQVTSLGLMVGYKLPIAKKFSMDFLIAGPGAGFYNFSIENKKDLPDEFYEDLNEVLNKYPIFDLLDGNFRFSAAHRRSNFNLLSLRYAISFGYSF
ncbi:MAG: DUF3575 domain-containing protein [Bacteroidales bacterium]|nr:DUF3575 domain-containing protein [Bacteroidales bacterium]